MSSIINNDLETTRQGKGIKLTYCMSGSFDCTVLEPVPSFLTLTQSICHTAESRILGLEDELLRRLNGLARIIPSAARLSGTPRPSAVRHAESEAERSFAQSWIQAEEQSVVLTLF